MGGGNDEFSSTPNSKLNQDEQTHNYSKRAEDGGVIADILLIYRLLKIRDVIRDYVQRSIDLFPLQLSIEN